MPEKSQRHRVLIAGTAIVTAILTSMGAPALADDRKTEPAACFLQAETGTTHCFADEAARDAAMIEIYGELPFDPDDAVAGRSAGTAVAATSVYIAKFYPDASYVGTFYPVTAPSSSFCTAGGVAQNPSLASGWNNVISSVKSFYGCVTTFYDGTSYSSLLGTWTNATSLGGANDRTSSYQVH